MEGQDMDMAWKVKTRAHHGRSRHTHSMEGQDMDTSLKVKT